MELKFKKREAVKKSEAKQLRREGLIPAVVYGPGEGNQHIAVVQVDYEAALRSLPKGGLSTQCFTLRGEEGEQIEAVVKEVQYHPTTYNVLHIDFGQLQKKRRVNVNVPIRFVDVDDCPGIKLGGTLRPVIRRLRVSCFPDQMPKELLCSVKGLNIQGAQKLSDVVLPEGVRPLMDLNEVAVVIAKR